MPSYIVSQKYYKNHSNKENSIVNIYVEYDLEHQKHTECGPMKKKTVKELKTSKNYIQSFSDKYESIYII